VLVTMVMILGLAMGSTDGVNADPLRGGPSMLDLGILPGGTFSSATGINEHGTIIGTANTATRATHAVRWDHTRQITDLGTFADFPDSVAHAINAHGVIVGYAASFQQDVVRAVRWDRAGQMTDLGVLPGATDSKPFGLNDEGTIVGISGSGGRFHAVRWDRAGRITDLGTLGGDESWALAVNNEGTVAGYSRTTGGTWHATRWDRAGRITDLAPTGGYTEAFGINDSGIVNGRSDGSRGSYWDRAGRMTILEPPGAQIVKISSREIVTATVFTDGRPARAMRWDRGGNPTVLSVLPSQEGNWSIANDANEHATAVGWSGSMAVKWDRRGRVTALGWLPGGNLSRAIHINDTGAIVGDAYDPATSDSHAVLWPNQ
jgi:probable HAF family extracellular repeat protein